MTKIGVWLTHSPNVYQARTPVANPVNIQIFQYDMVIYLGNLEMNSIGTEAMEMSNENSVIVGFLSFYDPPN